MKADDAGGLKAWIAERGAVLAAGLVFQELVVEEHVVEELIAEVQG